MIRSISNNKKVDKINLMWLTLLHTIKSSNLTRSGLRSIQDIGIETDCYPFLLT